MKANYIREIKDIYPSAQKVQPWHKAHTVQ